MATKSKKAASISFEDFTENTLAAVSRALIENGDTDHALFKNPHITMGIIWRPDFPDTTDLRPIRKR